MTTIQHQDMNVGPGYYKMLGDDKLLVFSIFYTLQGEGPHAGRPAVFIRLAGCNRGRKDDMGCKFCDTAFYFGQGKAMTFIDIMREAMSSMLLNVPEGHLPPLIVITGGEPMMQNNIVPFIQYVHGLANGAGQRVDIQIESNGDRVAPGFEKAMAELVVSPKMNGASYRLPPDSVINAAAAFKFVVSGDVDDPYYNIPVWASQLRCPVYVSPLTVYRKPHEPKAPVSAWDGELVDHILTARNYKRAASLALRRQFRVSMQQHLFFGVE